MGVSPLSPSLQLKVETFFAYSKTDSMKASYFVTLSHNENQLALTCITI